MTSLSLIILPTSRKTGACQVFLKDGRGEVVPTSPTNAAYNGYFDSAEKVLDACRAFLEAMRP